MPLVIPKLVNFHMEGFNVLGEISFQSSEADQGQLSPALTIASSCTTRPIFCKEKSESGRLGTLDSPQSHSSACSCFILESSS